jgi:hypothetical protein
MDAPGSGAGWAKIAMQMSVAERHLRQLYNL